MTDWTCPVGHFYVKNYPKTTLTLSKPLFTQIERTAQIARFSQCSMHPRDGGN